MKSMKFGFKPKLDPVQIEKIKDYIDINYIITSLSLAKVIAINYF
jgi:hypothetical protein